MKKLLPFLLLCGAAVGIWFFLKTRNRVKVNSASLQANKTAKPISTQDDWMADKAIVYGLVSALPTIVKGLAPGRWFNSEDTRQIYDENAGGGNVSDNDLEAYDQGFPT